jgi:membrane-bound serine protease (ClpP class)
MKRLWTAIAVVLFGLQMLSFAQAQTPRPLVVRLTFHDTVQPVSAGYLERGIHAAEAEHAAAVLIAMGTPGGLMTSMRDDVSAIERSTIPVIVYVSPTGARAASAGFFLLESADVAAMAPGTNTGAAHPIIEGRTLDPILKKKVEEDATALLRSITVPRHRDSAAATSAILDAKSYTAQEALQLHLIDVIEPSDTELLAALDGRTITRFDGSQTTLHLANAQVVELAPSLRERLLTRLTDPDLAVLLLLFGALLIYFEFHLPGTIVPGTLGTLCVLLAMFGLSILPLGHFALILLIAAVALFALELKVPSHGLLAAAGTVALIFGLLTLVDGGPDLRVHPVVAVSAGIAFGGISFALAWLGLRARRAKYRSGVSAMLGLTGRISRRTIDGRLHVYITVRGELWKAEPDTAAALEQGALAEVMAVRGLTLLVHPLAVGVPSLPVAE